MTIGETLRTAREAKGFSVQDVQTATHMTARQVTDIENDDFSSFAYPFYAKVFLRQFARAVGLDPAPLVARLAEESGSSGGDKTPSPVVPLETIDENDGGLKIVKPDIPDGGAVKRAAPPPEAPAKVAAPRPEKRVAASDPMVAAAAAAAAAAKPPVTELKPSDAPLPAKRAAFVRPGEVPPEPVSLRAPEEDVEARKVQPEFDFAPAVKKVVPESDSAAGEIVDPRAPVALPEFTAPSAPAFVFPFSSPPAQTAAFDEPDAAPAPVAPAPAP
ncbi:MAG: helix-turn-helix domain-containing protein, partial [Kiritimatiellae bacterium]|nr:helix-turn-helix domain-containing protein [Kiritimatiellia bacterium]